MVDNEYEMIANELSELKKLVIELKNDIKKRDEKIERLIELIDSDKSNSQELVKDEEKRKVLEEKNPKECYLYALKHKDVDVKEFGRIVIESKDLEYNQLFMKNIKGCDFDSHLQVILDSKDPQFNYYAALLHLDKEKINLIRQIIIDSKSCEYAYEFANDIKYIYSNLSEEDKDITDLEQVVIDSGNIMYCYKFAKNVDGADIDILEEILLSDAKEEDIETIFNFAVDIKGANVRELRNKIIDLYNSADKETQKEIVSSVDIYERKKIKCLFRNTFGEQVVIK